MQTLPFRLLHVDERPIIREYVMEADCPRTGQKFRSVVNITARAAEAMKKDGALESELAKAANKDYARALEKLAA